jgi:putative PIN family toxin of toxin-antitoxin system
MQAKPRVVLDTNLFISALISPEGTPQQLLRLWEQDRVILLTSSELIHEVDQVLHRDQIQARYRLTEEQIKKLLKRLQQTTERVIPLTALPLHSRDPKDDKLLALALGGTADYLITGDNDLLVLDGEPTLGNLRIITPAAFLQTL